MKKPHHPYRPLRLWQLGAVAAIVVFVTTSADGNAPAGQYAYTMTDATVTDTKTKLVWQRSPSTAAMTNPQAATYCAGIGTTLGGAGWRVPTMKELMTIADYSQSTPPLIDKTAFPATPSSDFWSSTPFGTNTANPTAWSFDFGTGFTYGTATPNMLSVRCVR